MDVHLLFPSVFKHASKRKSKWHADQEEDAHGSDRDIMDVANAFVQLLVFTRVQGRRVFARFLEDLMGDVGEGNGHDCYEKCDSKADR